MSVERCGCPMVAWCVLVLSLGGCATCRPLDKGSGAEFKEVYKELDRMAQESASQVEEAGPARVVVAVTDRELAADERLIRVAPENPPANVGIRVLAARQTPGHGQPDKSENESEINGHGITEYSLPFFHDQ